MDNRNKVTRPFGEPLDPSILEDFAVIDSEDIPSAVEWWDKHASKKWIGALDSTPIGKRKPLVR